MVEKPKPVNVSLKPADIDDVDDWRRRQPDLPAARRLYFA